MTRYCAQCWCVSGDLLKLPIVLVNTLRPRQNGRHFADDIFKRFFLNENVLISLNISLKFVAKVRINNIPALVQIMTWRRLGDKPLSEPMMVSLLTHICVTRPQWVKYLEEPFCGHALHSMVRGRWICHPVASFMALIMWMYMYGSIGTESTIFLWCIGECNHWASRQIRRKSPTCTKW